MEKAKARKSKKGKSKKIKNPAGAQDFFELFSSFFDFLMKFGELRDFSSIFVGGGGLFFRFWSVLQRLREGWIWRFSFFGGRWFFGMEPWFVYGFLAVGVTGGARCDWRRFLIVAGEFAGL